MQHFHGQSDTAPKIDFWFVEIQNFMLKPINRETDQNSKAKVWVQTLYSILGVYIMA